MNPSLRHAATVRRACSADMSAVSAFFQGLSLRNRRLRFHGASSGTSPSLLKLLCDVDGQRHQAWFAWAKQGAAETVVGEARFVRDSQGDAAELAIAVADDQQGSGLAQSLMQRLLESAASAGVRELYGHVMDGNDRMEAFMRRFGFEAGRLSREGVIRMRRRLAPVVLPA